LPKVSSPSLGSTASRWFGGDTVRGPRVVTITALGLVPRRSRCAAMARGPGDVLYVSGSLGEAAAGLRCCAPVHWGTQAIRLCAVTGLRSRASHWAARCVVAPPQRWTSRMACSATSQAVRREWCRRRLDLDRLPISDELARRHSRGSASNSRCAAATDYELLFTLPPWTRRRSSSCWRSRLRCDESA